METNKKDKGEESGGQRVVGYAVRLEERGQIKLTCGRKEKEVNGHKRSHCFV